MFLRWYCDCQCLCSVLAAATSEFQSLGLHNSFHFKSQPTYQYFNVPQVHSKLSAQHFIGTSYKVPNDFHFCKKNPKRQLMAHNYDLKPIRLTNCKYILSVIDNKMYRVNMGSLITYIGKRGNKQQNRWHRSYNEWDKVDIKYYFSHDLCYTVTKDSYFPFNHINDVN